MTLNLYSTLNVRSSPSVENVAKMKGVNGREKKKRCMQAETRVKQQKGQQCQHCCSSSEPCCGICEEKDQESRFTLVLVDIINDEMILKADI